MAAPAAAAGGAFSAASLRVRGVLTAADVSVRVSRPDPGTGGPDGGSGANPGFDPNKNDGGPKADPVHEARAALREACERFGRVVKVRWTAGPAAAAQIGRLARWDAVAAAVERRAPPPRLALKPPVVGRSSLDASRPAA